MGFLTAFGSVIGVYIMGMAVLSPCPLLVNHISGAILIVSCVFHEAYLKLTFFVLQANSILFVVTWENLHLQTFLNWNVFLIYTYLNHKFYHFKIWLPPKVKIYIIYNNTYNLLTDKHSFKKFKELCLL